MAYFKISFFLRVIRLISINATNLVAENFPHWTNPLPYQSGNTHWKLYSFHVELSSLPVWFHMVSDLCLPHSRKATVGWP